MLDELLNDLDVLTEFDKENYQELKFTEIEAISKKGTDQGAAKIDSQWVPKSQMKCDFDKNIYVTIWFYAKLDI